jgi:hydroxymethylpyrimidine kinase/phosphomethylpyrimidine kinase/thiamine-phosphate diphosphorylase
MRPAVLTIAGSDPSGGAGLQADLRVFAALGVVGCSVVTALTVQTGRGVRTVSPVAAELLRAQIEALLDDVPFAAAKIGMLGGAAQVEAVAAALERRPHGALVLDPVLASTGGVPLLDAEGRAALLACLLPLADVVTPNTIEAEVLTGQARPEEAARRLLARGARAVLIKGGHRDGPPIDRLYQSDGTVRSFDGPRLDTPHTHGTGCALSAAMAAHLARGAGLGDAIAAAKADLTAALRRPVMVGAGRGYPGFGFGGRTHEERLRLLRGLYVLTDSELRPERAATEIVDAALAGGARIVQLRDKRLATPELVQLARHLAARARAAEALFIVNDRVDMALAADADGVHLGPDDLPPADARRLLGPDAIVGVSVSSVEEARDVAPFASYLGIGAIFGSTTKLDAGPPVGVARIAEIRAAYPRHRTVAIGGIDASNIAEVAASGVDAAAVVSAVVCAPDMRAAATELVGRFEAARLVI